MGLLGLDQDRQPRESRVVQQPAERLEPDAPVTDVLVTIDAAAARPLRIVAVKNLQPLDADDPIELIEGVAITRLGRDVVARRHEVAGIEADADPFRSAQVCDDRGKVVEAVPERPALARRMFEQHHRLCARPRLEGDSDGVRDETQGLVIRSRRACARVQDDAKQTERLGAIDLIHECRDRLLAQDGERRREIDQVTRVRDDRGDDGLLDAAAEQSDFGGVERLAAPLARVLGEDLQRLAFVHDRALDGLGDAARDGHVRADSHESL